MDRVGRSLADAVYLSVYPVDGEVPEGNGYVDGYGSGSGIGCGDGYGSGSGIGCGDGNVSGYGSGSGYGNSYGSGSGYCIIERDRSVLTFNK